MILGHGSPPGRRLAGSDRVFNMRDVGRGQTLIGQLYDIERSASQRALDAAERQKLREQKSAPLMNALREHIEQLSYRAIPKSLLGKAVSYALHQWEPLTVFLSNGAVAIDNNLTEQ